MKVPANIKKAIIETARANAIAYRNSEIVRDWLSKKG